MRSAKVIGLVRGLELCKYLSSLQAPASYVPFRPSLEAVLPPGWIAKESITLLAPDGLANVIASSEPLAPEIATDEYAAAQGRLLRTEFPGYVENAFEEIEMFGGRSGYLRRFEWSPPDGERVTQLQLYYVENGRGYTATATSPSTVFRQHETEIIGILLRLRISPTVDSA
jgi:hypothetical protein